MKNKGFGHLKTRLFTIKTSKNVGLGGPWYIYISSISIFGPSIWHTCDCFCCGTSYRLCDPSKQLDSNIAEINMSNEKNPGCLWYIGNCTAKLYRDYDNPK